MGDRRAGEVIGCAVQPYAPRRIRARGVGEADDWRVKIHSIVLDGSAPDPDVFEPAIALALNTLPFPARVPGRPGLGFLLAHTGRGSWYTVLWWWDHDNELPIAYGSRSTTEARRAGVRPK